MVEKYFHDGSKKSLEKKDLIEPILPHPF